MLYNDILYHNGYLYLHKTSISYNNAVFKWVGRYNRYNYFLYYNMLTSLEISVNLQIAMRSDYAYGER